MGLLLSCCWLCADRVGKVGMDVELTTFLLGARLIAVLWALSLGEPVRQPSLSWSR